MLVAQTELQFADDKELIKRFLPTTKGISVLDFGAGNLAFSLALATELDVSKISCIENDERILSFAPSNLPEIMGVYPNIGDLPKGISFDLILFRFVVHHLGDDDLKQIAQAAKNLLSPDGVVVIFTPNDQGTHFDPKPNQFIELLNSMRASSPNRQIKSKEIVRAFAPLKSISCLEHAISPNPANKQLFFDYITATGEAVAEAKLPEKIFEELIDWWSCAPEVVYGYNVIVMQHEK